MPRARLNRLLLCLVCFALPLAAPGIRRVGAKEPATSVVTRAEALVRQDKLADAAALLETHLQQQPTDYAARVALGDVHRRRCDLTSARTLFEALVSENPLDPEGNAGLSNLAVLRGDGEEALRLSSLALRTEAGKRSSNAWRAHTNALVELRRYRDAVIAGRQAIRAAPEDARAHEAFARAAFRGGDMLAARGAYLKAATLDPNRETANMALGNGFSPKLSDWSWTRRRAGELWRQSVLAWERGQLVEAQRGFEALCQQQPLNYKFRLGLGLVRRSVRHRSDVDFGGAVRDAYLKLPAPEVQGLETYVVNWRELEPWEQRVIRIATAPARRWMRALIRKRATHEILDVQDNLHDARKRRYLTDRLTFDKRRYAQIRGVGGVDAASGIETLHTAAAFGFNTFAHEFAHQIHRMAFPKPLQKELDRLYAVAVRQNRPLDYYAASNVDEYFAQGYEALVSLKKRGCLSDTARHTRAELREKDPALYQFLIRNFDLSHESGNALEPFRAAAPGD